MWVLTEIYFLILGGLKGVQTHSCCSQLLSHALISHHDVQDVLSFSFCSQLRNKRFFT